MLVVVNISEIEHFSDFLLEDFDSGGCSHVPIELLLLYDCVDRLQTLPDLIPVEDSIIVLIKATE
jgi:hypothetical protein